MTKCKRGRPREDIDHLSSEVVRLSAAGQRHSDMYVAVTVCPSVDQLSLFIAFAICFLESSA